MLLKFRLHFLISQKWNYSSFVQWEQNIYSSMALNVAARIQIELKAITYGIDQGLSLQTKATSWWHETHPPRAHSH
jgi:hypothetical protein